MLVLGQRDSEKIKNDPQRSFNMKKETKKRLLKAFVFTGVLVGIITYGKFSFDEYVNQKVQEEGLKKDREIQNLKQVVQRQEASVTKLETVIKLQKEKNKRFDKLIQDLNRCKFPKTSLGIGFSESHLKYSVNHPTSDLSGIGGIKPGYWGRYLAKKKIDVNSLQAIDAVYTAMLAETKDRVSALKYYKGTGKNTKSFVLTRAYIHTINESIHFDAMMEAHKKQLQLEKSLKSDRLVIAYLIESKQQYQV